MRKIDADALMQSMYHMAFETDGDTMWNSGCWVRYRAVEKVVNEQPTVDVPICGYSIKHLQLIAEVLQKEGLPPERVAEALTDIGRIITIISDEFEESLRRSINQCFSANRLKTTAFNCDEVIL